MLNPLLLKVKEALGEAFYNELDEAIFDYSRNQVYEAEYQTACGEDM